VPGISSREAAMSRIERRKKVFIIFNADMMNTEASNSLLKTLEEPLPGTILLLTTSAKDQLIALQSSLAVN